MITCPGALFVVGLTLTLAAMGCSGTSDDQDDGSSNSSGGPIPETYQGKDNPFDADDAEALASGETLYTTNCAGCHGDEGKGDGPTAGSLAEAPTDLSGNEAAGWDDDFFLWRISDGIEDDGMPSFKGGLSEDEIWKVITFARTFAD